MAMINGNNTILATFNGRQHFIDSCITYDPSGANLWRGTFIESSRWTTNNVIYGRTASGSYFMGSEYSFEVEPDTVYHYTATKTGPATLAVIINQYDSSGAYISTVGNQPDFGLLNDDILWTTPSNCKYWTITYRDQHSVTTLTPEMVSDIILEKVES